MAYDYERIANEFAGPNAQDMVRAVAENLHYNESMHMHEQIEATEPCSYCWLRAGRSVRVMRQFESQPTPASSPSV
ncbi:hypothetical protein GCM10010193_70090 [Kitasatospora atroaurantiaca]|uniref:Uncharacterized protein n=1 Tax=Kitasatospora atroaurantiaca TaxID=285545 RepID=A0A561ENA7_9ACTN|nr:hypothetical protein [Kitasatospora atroaurantiaca]TWE17095.1 hypothetical protein FB465_2100 [Kitasatospora atroaurantiaca]